MPIYFLVFVLCRLFPIDPPSIPPHNPIAPPKGTAPSDKNPPRPVAPPAKSKGASSSKTAPAPPPRKESLTVVTPDPCLPGQTVTLTWPYGVKQVEVLEEGRFKRLPISEGASQFTAPSKSRTYAFKLWSDVPESKGAGGRMRTRRQRGGRRARLHLAAAHRYPITIQVFSGKFPSLATYRDQHHWHIDCVAGWNRNAVPQPDPKNNALVFFQPQADSAERLAVSILPATNLTAEDLMKQVMNDAPTQYDVIKSVTQKEALQCGVPAVWLTFSGLDQALSGVPTRSMVLTFVKEGHGYIISGRARSSLFTKWDKVLRCLVRSFAVDPAAALKLEAANRKPRPGKAPQPLKQAH